MFNLHNIALFVTTILGGLITGLFYAYSVSVNPGLGKLSDIEYLKAMQSINLAILNPLFFLSFMGYLFALPVCVWLNYKQPLGLTFYLVVAAFALYAVGTFGVTMVGNVPLNNALANFDIAQADVMSLAQQRKTFEVPWNTLHSVRTIFCFISFGLTLAALLIGKK